MKTETTKKILRAVVGVLFLLLAFVMIGGIVAMAVAALEKRAWPVYIALPVLIGLALKPGVYWASRAIDYALDRHDPGTN